MASNAITSVTVLRNLPEGVTCVANDSTMPEMTTKQSYNMLHDSVMFARFAQDLAV